jgi:hypothetical protein
VTTIIENTIIEKLEKQLIREIRIGSCGIALLAVGERVIRECLQLAKKTTQATRDDNTLLHTINNVKLHMFSCIRS